MWHLARYVEVINKLNQDSPLKIIRHEKRQNIQSENDLEVYQSSEKFYFDNGSIIKKKIEQDNMPAEVEACMECWIQYEVVQHPPPCPISPVKIQFNSHCRELYWIKYFK